MRSRVHARTLQLLAEGLKLDKYNLAVLAVTSTKVAYKVLKVLRERGHCHVSSWRNSGRQKIPVYSNGEGKDKPKPASKDRKEVSREWRRRNPEYFDKVYATRRIRRSEKRMLSKGDPLSMKSQLGV